MKSSFLLPLLIVLAGCRNPAPGYVPVPPEEIPKVSFDSVKDAKDLMPLAVGNHWTYQYDTQNYDKAGKPEKPFGGKANIDIAARWPNGTGVLVVSQSGNVVDRQAWFGDDKGMLQVEGGVEGTAYRPGLPAFTLPLAAGKRFEWRGSGPTPLGGSASMTAQGEILEPQNVDLAKGTVSAIPIVTRIAFPGGNTVSTSWFRPGVGLVRLHQETTGRGIRTVTTLALIEHKNPQ